MEEFLKKKTFIEILEWTPSEILRGFFRGISKDVPENFQGDIRRIIHDLFFELINGDTPGEISEGVPLKNYRNCWGNFRRNPSKNPSKNFWRNPWTNSWRNFWRVLVRVPGKNPGGFPRLISGKISNEMSGNSRKLDSMRHPWRSSYKNFGRNP